MRTLRSKNDRAYLWILANGKCRICGKKLEPNKWHADHIIPYKVNKNTSVDSMQATCPKCNLKKGDKVSDNKFTLRKHQSDLIKELQKVIDDYKKTGILNKKQLVEEIFPGGGKSIHPLIAGRMLIDAGIVDKVCWVVPRTSLKIQGAQECIKPEINDIFPHGLEFREVETSNDEDPTRGTDGFIVTYQGLASAKANNPERENNNYREFRQKRYLLFLDEVHHVTKTPPVSGGDQKGYTYYQAVKPLYDLASFVICSSGTLFRNNDQKVAFIEYKPDGDKEYPIRDIIYTYEDSVKEKANIRLYVDHGITKLVEYKKDGKQHVKYKIENGDDRRVALSTEYGRSLLDAGIKAWENYRLLVNPRSKLIIIGKDQDSCREYKSILSKYGHNSCLAISDEKQAHNEIKRFREEPDANILITCQMAYEGLDCKQATHCIVLTDIRSLGWLIQMLTRVMRADTHKEALAYERQYSVCFCPDDEDMMDAIKKVGGELDGSVNNKDDDFEELLSQLNADSVSPQEKPIFTDCKSIMDGMSQMHPDGETLPPETRVKVQQFKIKQGLESPESEIYKILRSVGQLHALDNVVSAVTVNNSEHIGMTVREQEKSIRKKIQLKASWLDNKFGYEFGEWNKKLHNHFRYKNRKDMTIAELNNCYDWMISEAKKIAEKMRLEKERELSIKDPFGHYDPKIHSKHSV